MRGLGPATAVAIVAIVAFAAPAAAQELDEADWSPEELEGAPADAGFLAGGFIAVGVSDTGAVLIGEGPCEISEADLYLVTFPDGDGCVDAVDATDRDGVQALATAERYPRVFIAPEEGSSGPDLIAYDVEDGNLTHAFERSLSGFVTLLDANPQGDRAVTVSQDGDDPETATHRLNAYLEDGTRERSYQVGEIPLALDLSHNARYAAVGGEATQDDDTAGWVHVFDLTRSAQANPVVEHVIPGGQGKTVNSTAVTNQGAAYAGSLDGTVTRVTPQGNHTSLDLGDGAASVDTNRDGSLVAAASGDTVSRLTLDEELSTRWVNQTGAFVDRVIVRSPYVVALADQAHVHHRDGQGLWEIPTGPVVAANRTGLGWTTATQGSTGTGPAASPTSNVQAWQVPRSATVTASEDVPIISPGGSGHVNLTVENTGTAVLQGSLEDRRSPLDVRFAPEDITLLPGENRTLQATVDVPRNQRAGLVDVPVEFVSAPRVDANATLTVDVGRSTQLDLRLEPGSLAERSVVQGQNVTVHLLLDNRGNTDTTATLSTHQSPTEGDRWSVNLSDRDVTVPEGSTTSLRLDTTVPPDAEDGTVNQIIVRASTETASTAVSLQFTVNPFEAVELSPDRVTKTLAPGTTTAYTFTVTNLGSIPTNVTIGASEIDDQGTLLGPGAWGIALDRSIHPLDPQEEGEITLELTAPTNATDAEDRSIRVQVLATTDQGERATSVAFGVADPSLADDEDDDTNQDQTPFPSLLVPASLLAALLLHRRTYHGNL